MSACARLTSRPPPPLLRQTWRCRTHSLIFLVRACQSRPEVTRSTVRYPSLTGAHRLVTMSVPLLWKRPVWTRAGVGEKGREMAQDLSHRPLPEHPLIMQLWTEAGAATLPISYDYCHPAEPQSKSALCPHAKSEEFWQGGPLGQVSCAWRHWHTHTQLGARCACTASTALKPALTGENFLQSGIGSQICG